MSTNTDRLAAEYLATESLAGLPDRHFIDGTWIASVAHGKMESWDAGKARPATARRMAREIDAGQVYTNQYFAGGIEVPFGGNKMSGFGREKGLQALRSYCTVKSVAARIAG